MQSRAMSAENRSPRSISSVNSCSELPPFPDACEAAPCSPASPPTQQPCILWWPWLLISRSNRLASAPRVPCVVQLCVCGCGNRKNSGLLANDAARMYVSRNRSSAVAEISRCLFAGNLPSLCWFLGLAARQQRNYCPTVVVL